MRKFVPALALFLCLAARSSAGFTPPTDLTPFLPPANPATGVRVVAVLGPYTVWTCDQGVSAPLALPAVWTPAQKLAAATLGLRKVESWYKFRLATVSQDSLSDPAVVNTASYWWQTFVLPAF